MQLVSRRSVIFCCVRLFSGRTAVSATTPWCSDTMRVADLHWGRVPVRRLGEVAAVFPRLDAKVVIPQMRELEQKELARQNALLGRAPEPQTDASTPAGGMSEGVSPLAPPIVI